MHPHLSLALELTQIPTAAGREQRVIAFIERWCAARPQLALSTDAVGNMTVALHKSPPTAEPPLYITGHLDHPAFVVERTIGPGTLEVSFRGGVMPVFFEDAPVTLHTGAGPVDGVLTGKSDPSTPAGQHYTAEFPGGTKAAVGDIATWTLPTAEIDSDGVLHTHACDDLVAVAAAMAAMDELLAAKAGGSAIGDVRLLFTRAEEIGFIGAIAACRLGTIPRGARVVALENSRAFPDSPVGGGPIVRVGDRMSVFTPWLTAACAARAEQVFGHPATPSAAQTAAAHAGKRPWQRKLMAGGACEAGVFCHAGFDATCLCLPLGNYHNMPHLAELQAGTYDAAASGPPRCAREFIHTQDYLGLIDLLVALGTNLPSSSPLTPLLDKLYSDKKYVL
ncbi:MAG TPA: M20/M25/M40 family metallo-hydrolase [Phycisphaerales bacterium]|nr:M20/M25/M40 family metallo-hydrolase [Phycisphaerales bacterium]